MFEFPESYHVSSNFAERRYYTNLKSPYFRSAGGYGHMAGHAGSPMCIAHTDVTLTWSKLKVKVTDLVKFRKLHFSMSTSSAILSWRWRSQLAVDYDSMEPGLWLFRARLLKFSPIGGQVTSKFAKCGYHQNPLRFISALQPAARSLWLWSQVGRNKPCMLAAMTVSPLAGLFYLQAGCSSWRPTNSVKMLNGWLRYVRLDTK